MSVSITEPSPDQSGKTTRQAPAVSYCLVDGVSLDKGLSLEIRRDLAPPLSGRKGKRTTTYELVQVCEFHADLRQKAEQAGKKRNIMEAYLLARKSGDQGINELRQIMKGYRLSYWMHHPQGKMHTKQGQAEINQRIAEHQQQYSNKYPKAKEVSIGEILG